MEYRINNRVIKLDIKGKKSFGKNECLFKQDDKILKKTDWKKEGFTIQPFLESSDFEKLKSGFKSLLEINIRNAGGKAIKLKNLEKYHRHIDDKLHVKTMAEIQAFLANAMPISYKIIEERISEICKTKLVCMNNSIGFSTFHLRVVRPNSKDNNPLHKDVYIDRLKKSINIYVPIAGSNQKSSLCLAPGSHLWPESEIERTTKGAIIGNTSFSVPAITSTKPVLKITRPNPKLNEVLVFTPYLIHGGAINFNKNKTRVSLEMRFWKK